MLIGGGYQMLATQAYIQMIETAEVVAERYGISRDAQDEYSYQSQMRTAAAQEAEPPDSSAASPTSDGPRKPKAPFYASPYVQLGSWEYPILDYWISAGRISSLSPFVQPYRRVEVECI